MSLSIAQWIATGLIPTSGLQAWHQYEPAVSGHYVIFDYSGNSRHIQVATSAEDPVLTADVIAGQPAWYFNGTDTNPLSYTGAINAKDTFVLGSFEETTFAQYRGLLSGLTFGEILVSNNSGDKLFDFGLDEEYVYRKSDVVYANNNLVAPIGGDFALMEVQSPSGIAMDGIRVGQQTSFTSRLHKGYFVEQLIYNRVLTLAERMRVMLYFNLKYKQFQVGLPFYFPSDDFMPFRRRRFYAEPPMYSKITDSYEFEDGGRTFNETADAAPRRWEYNYKFNNTAAATDPGEIHIFDEFNDAARLSNPFYFTDKYGVTWDNVRIESYDRDHDAHKPWTQEVKFKLIRFPN